MTAPDESLIAELPEAAATGELAAIYDEVRRYTGVPYVSSLQRQLATLPGALPWAWGSVGPAFRSGLLPTTAWCRVAELPLSPLAPIPRPALRLMGVAAEDEPALRAICASFRRASPVNLLFGACLRRLLAGESGGSGAPSVETWTPLEPTPPLPAMVDPTALPEDVGATLLCFCRGEGAQAFVPGNYRMFARWPGFLAHLAIVLPPFLAAQETERVCHDLAETMDRTAPDILAALPSELPPLPSPEVRETILGALAKYHSTSPEMVVVHDLLAEALPKP
jgi:hypothetical protein